jgi:hypothetical protein
MRALRLACVAFASAALLAGCGSSVGLISSDSAATLQTDLANIQLAFAAPDCTLASAYVAKAEDDFENLPQSVNPQLLAQLQDGMFALASDEHHQCTNSTSSTGPTNTGPTGQTGVTGTTSTTSTTTTTSSSTTSSTTSSTSTGGTTGTTGITGPTCPTTTGVGGGTPACEDSTSSTSSTSGIGGAGTGGTGTNTGAASIGN